VILTFLPAIIVHSYSTLQPWLFHINIVMRCLIIYCSLFSGACDRLRFRALREDEASVLGDEWLVIVVDLVFPVICSPRRCIPDRSVQPHGPCWESVRVRPSILSYWDVIHKKYNLQWSPENAVTVKILSGIKPEVDLLLPSCNNPPPSRISSSYINVGL